VEDVRRFEPRTQMTGRRRLILLAAFVMLGSAAAYVLWGPVPGRDRHRPDPLPPYANARPGVKYLGDSSCTRCHAEIAESFRRHPMGRSLSPITAAGPEPDDARNGRPLFEAQGLQYGIEHRGGRVIHTETRSDAGGRVIARNEAEVQFRLGSGRQGVAFLIDRDGFLFESPLTWYPGKRRWDLSPGYEAKNSHFDRPIIADCLFCHANRVEPVAGTVNRYQPPTFRGHAIGCERCHGPGELHVRRPDFVDGRATTIVNPAALEPSLREAVCEQCHLIGQHRIVRPGRRNEDYRPGLPFYRFWSVLESADQGADARFVGQVEQMHESRCFRASSGRLGCISCHDPHRLPEPGERVAYYRGRCLECHADRGCRLPTAARLARSGEDDCAGCHMPRSASSDIRHVATTDHRVPRDGASVDRPVSGVPGPSTSRLRLVRFHRDLMDEEDRAEARRDIGVALGREGAEAAAGALPLLQAALAARPEDVQARESEGLALGRLGRPDEGLAALRTALAQDPTRESTWVSAAYLAAQAGRLDDAVTYWQRAIAISPWRASYHAELSLVWFRSGDRGAAARVCREALRLDPTNIEVRKLLVQCYIDLKESAAAREQFGTLLGFDPPDRDVLLRWFGPQLGPGAQAP
jgi:Flp pilus assembly protein TadD